MATETGAAPNTNEPESVIDWIYFISAAREKGRCAGDPDKFYILDELKNPSRADNEQFAKMYVQREEYVQYLEESMVAIARRMTAHEIATGASTLYEPWENPGLLSEFGLKQISNAESGQKHDILFNELFQRKQKARQGYKVYMTIANVMDLFQIPKGQYAAARRIMRNAADAYPEHVNMTKVQTTGKKEHAVIEYVNKMM